MDKTDLGKKDAAILRELAEWQAAAATSAANRDKTKAWYAHDAHAPDRRPLLIVEMCRWQGDHGPIRERDLRCSDPWARGIEYDILNLRHHVEVYKDDHVVPDFVPVTAPIGRGDFGVPDATHREAGADSLSFNFRPSFSTLDDAELAKLRHRSFRVDREAQIRNTERLSAVFGGILKVEVHDAPWQFTYGITGAALGIIGLENLMLFMYDNPKGLHKLMAFIRDDHAMFMDWMEAENLWALNNGADYVCAGTFGFTRDLPAPGFNGRVRCKDRWSGFESQESIGISPEQFEEFVFAYQKPLMARFGKIYYGCCEPVNAAWHCLEKVPNLARVSVSPWADEEFMGRACRERRIVYSRKPSPNFVSAERFDEDAFRAHIARTVAAARGCSLEIIQRDVYVTNNSPERFVRWVEICREECATWRSA